MTSTQPSAWCRADVLLAGLILVLLAGRWAWLAADLPYGIVSSSGDFESDEGWYTKSALLQTRFGVWEQPYDLTVFTHNVLFSSLLRIAFAFGGATLTTARALSVLASVVAIGAFFVLIRQALPRFPALIATCLVAVTLSNVTYARMAIREPLGTACSLLALATWVRARRGLPLRAAWSLALALAAVLVKVIFVFTLLTLMVLWLGDAARHWPQRRGRALALGLVVLAALCTCGGMLALLRWGWADNWRAYIDLAMVPMLQEYRAGLSLPVTELRAWFWTLPRVTGPPFWPLLLLGVGGVLLLRHWPHQPWRYLTRADTAMLLWGLLGITALGGFWYQPLRYFFFVMFPLAHGLVTCLTSLVPPQRWRGACVGLLIVHLLGQTPGFVRWLTRPDLFSQARMAHEVTALMRREVAAPVLMGRRAALVALFDPDVRPIEVAWLPRQGYTLSDRVAYWHPHFFLGPPSESREVATQCAAQITALQPMARYTVMDNYYSHADLVLYRLAYAPAGADTPAGVWP